jgi:hypothetical protein
MEAVVLWRRCGVRTRTGGGRLDSRHAAGASRQRTSVDLGAEQIPARNPAPRALKFRLVDLALLATRGDSRRILGSLARLCCFALARRFIPAGLRAATDWLSGFGGVAIPFFFCSNRYGRLDLLILVLDYVLLARGLNLVVDLTGLLGPGYVVGLLDRGYVARLLGLGCAGGVFSYALLAQNLAIARRGFLLSLRWIREEGEQ